MAKGVETYLSKRRFNQTPEPQGGRAGEGDPIFVVQQHHARRNHYDLRLQIGDTLKSWAVPEGPCLDPKVRRFAKLVEDHPIDYANFEGEIPAGNYGAGAVIVWDRGPWVTLSDPEESFQKGEIKFRLAGKKLTGGWMLKRLPKDPTDWLLIKERDPSVRRLEDYDILVEQPASVISGRRLPDKGPNTGPETGPEDEAVDKHRKKPPRRQAAKIAGAVAAPTPQRWKPQLATPAPAPPEGAAWVHEIKYDGYRTLCFIENAKVRLITRNGHDWTSRYGELARIFERLNCSSAILDGEVVVQDPQGVSSLDLLEQALSEGRSHALTYYAFDLMFLDGYDLSAARLLDRKAALLGLIDPVIQPNGPLQFSEHIKGDGAALFAEASRLGLEGVVSKRAQSRYVQSRSPNWVKAKKVDIAEFVIIGFISNMPKSASSLILAEERHGELLYASRVGSGIGEVKSRELYAALCSDERPTPVIAAPRIPGAHWVEPNFTAEIGYRSRSANDAPRAPVLMSYQPRKPAPVPALKPRLVGDRDLAAVRLTNPDRVIFEGSVTKLDLALYYARVGDWLLPELLRRPLTMLRCPSGDIKDCFYQRHAFAGLPPGVEGVSLKDEEGQAAFITVTEPKGYLALTQFGAVELHLWGCHVDDPEHPDRLIIDLDPDPTLSWRRVCDGAEVLRKRLQALGFLPFLRTTGGKGLHLVMALSPGQTWAELKGFAEAFSKSMAAELPELFVANASKERRKGRIYLDYLRNGRGASAVASYSVRARPGFPVATPIAWEELRKLSGADAFNLRNLPRRIETLARDPWDELSSSGVKITASMRRDVGMKS